MSKTAIIIGASSGIGKALAALMSEKGYTLGLTARRLLQLEELQHALPSPSHIVEMDVTKFQEAEAKLEALIETLERVDIIIISAGIGHHNPDLKADLELDTIQTNACGFVVQADAAMRYFLQQGHGHLVGISSVAAVFGNAGAPAYNASKAFISNYMKGLRIKGLKHSAKISVTDIRPGFVDTPMAQSKNLFWMSSPEVAAQQILKAIENKKNCAYITRRWRLIAWLFKILPYSLQKLSS